jgi:hypothetical protein
MEVNMKKFLLLAAVGIALTSAIALTGCDDALSAIGAGLASYKSGEENAEKLDFSLVLTGVTADSKYTAVVYDGAGKPLASAAGKAGEDSISFPFSLVSGEYLVKVAEVTGGSKTIKSYPDVVFAVGLSEVELAWDEVEAEEPVAEDAEVEEAEVVDGDEPEVVGVEEPEAVEDETEAETPVVVVDVEEPEAEEPEAEKPVVVEVEEPVAEEPVAEEPVADEPVAEEPVADEPVAEEPVVVDVEEPEAEKPVADKPEAEKPVADEPVAEKPVADDARI